MSEYIEVGQPLQFTDPNTPTRVGEIVENVSDIYNIPSPRLGMQVFVKSEKKSFVITSLKSKVVNGVDVPEAAVEAFEAVGAKSITWNNDTDPNNMNDFVVAGVYDIKGEHTREDDNLPILNTGGGHSFNARLTVLDSSISGSGNSDDKCITQVLSFSNRLGQGEVYIRTGKGSSLYNLTWENWSTLQRNVNVGEVGSLDDLKDNGIYSGVWKQGRTNPNYLAFVCIVINDYFIGIAPRRVSQFVYGLSKSDGSVVYQSRVWDDSKGMWGNWEILNQKEIASMISAEIKKVTDGVDPNKIDSLKDIITWIEEHGDVAGILAAIEGLYDELGREIDARMSVDNDTRGKGVLFGGFSNRQTTADEVVIGYKNIDQKAEGAFTIPAATTEKAGVMSAEDKGRLVYQLIRLAGFSTANAVNSGDIVYNNNSSSSTYRKLMKYVGIISGVKTFEDVPFIDGAIYTYNNKLFTYNGTELIDVSSELAVSLLQGAFAENVSFYTTYNSAEVATDGHYINNKGSIVAGANFGYTNPIKVSEGEVLTVQGLGINLPYYVWATETGEILSIGDICSDVVERKVMTLSQDGYIILNIRRAEASTVGAPYFCATISNGLLIKERLAKLEEPNPIVNELKVDTGMSIKYIPNETDIAETNAHISVNGSIASNAVVAYTKPIQVKKGDVLSVQGLGPGFPYYAYVNEAGAVLSIGDVCSSVLERKVMTLSQDGYIALNLRIKKATNAAAPPFEAVISSKKLTKDLIQELYEPTRITSFAQKEYPNADIDKNECYVAFYNAMMKKCADYGIEGAVIGGPAGYGLESWNGIEIERGKSNVDIYGLIKILGLVYGDWRLVDMWGEYDNPTLSIPIMRGTSIVNQEISSTLGRSQFSYILKDNYCVLAAKGGTHEGIAVNYSAACTCDALKGNVVIGYVNTNINSDTDSISRYRAFKYLMDIAVRKFEDRNSNVADLEELLLGQNVLRAVAVIIPNTNPQLLHNLDFANSSYYKLYEYNPGMVDTMSTIKSLTAAVALDYINDLNTLVTIKGSDITDATGGTHPIFNAGDKLTIKDLIYANSVRSSNQASYALARIIGQAILKNERL